MTTDTPTKPKRRRRRRRKHQPPAVQQRSAFLDPDGWFADIVSPSSPITGQRVTNESAMGFSAYFAGIRAISEDTAKLPLKVYRRLEPMGKQPLRSHPVWRLMNDEANPQMSGMTFRETLQAHALGYHGGFAWIVRNGDNRPKELIPLDPRSVSVASVDGETFYRVIMDNGSQAFIPDRDMFHLHGLGLDGLTGYVLTQIGRDAIGSALGSQRYSGAFFHNGARPSGILEVPGALKDQAFDRLRTSFADRYQGAENASKPLILEEGIKWNQTGMSPEDSQMIETMEFHIGNVARLLRIPPHKLQQLLRATFSNIEHQAIEYVTDTLGGWFVRWSQEIHRKLFLPGEQPSIVAEHQAEALLRGDIAAQATFFREMNAMGVLSINEIRDKLNLNPVPNGNARFINSASITLEHAIEQPQTEPASITDQSDTESDEDDTDTGSNNDQLRALDTLSDSHKRLVEMAFRRLVRVEIDKVGRARRYRDFAVWKDGFIQDHPEWVVNSVGSAIDAYVSAVGSVLDTGDVDLEVISFEASKRIAERHMIDAVVPMLNGQGLPDDYITQAATHAVDFAADAVAASLEAVANG